MPIFIENRETLLLDQIRNLLRQSDKAYFALAFVRNSGVRLIRADIEALIKRNGSAEIVFANDFGATEASAINTLREIGVSLRFYSDAFSFHPKAYIFQNGEKIWAIIGSSNLSSSGLSQGIEWNVLLSPRDTDCSNVLAEFSKLWRSPNARTVTDNIISNLERVNEKRAVVETLRRYDRHLRVTVNTSRGDILTTTGNYVVHRTPDAKSEWAFQIYRGKLKELAKQGEFNIVVVCDYQTPQEKVFVIPFRYLGKKILAHAQCDKTGRYIFEVNKQTYRFNWHRSVPMEGKQFLVK